ncbi:hypothetical protein [Halodurantibacterium flavum]|uniref:Outer membrane protein beta-barrel domain-containing protein n=1 Tax=Halodurantibacterium flavum TaxID=1382802 RepID=A0ABW4S611_9RHOB
MKHLARSAAFSVASVVASGAAVAQMPGDVTLGGGVSTLGATLEVSSRLTDQFGIRVPVGYGSYSRTETVDGTPLDGDLRLGGVGLLADYFPMANGFRISGGVFYNNYRMEGDARGTVTVQGRVYTGEVNAEVNPRSDFSPMLVIGYDSNPYNAGWGFSGDLGAIFGRGFDVSVTGEQDGGPLLQDQFEEDLADLERSIRDDVSGWRTIPYVKLAVTYRF